MGRGGGGSEGPERHRVICPCLTWPSVVPTAWHIDTDNNAPGCCRFGSRQRHRTECDWMSSPFSFFSLKQLYLVLEFL